MQSYFIFMFTLFTVDRFIYFHLGRIVKPAYAVVKLGILGSA
jgi:hypothetical protein